MAKTPKRRAPYEVMTAIMNEPIRLPGCPQIIVTRSWAWSWMARMGFERDTRKGPFSTIDYFVGGAKRVDEPLTDLSDQSVVRFLAAVEADILGERVEAAA